jgi:outer membrane protein OmpA-like peptidoglycan-associated protein
MRHTSTTIVAVLAVTSTLCATARAQEQERGMAYPKGHVPAPSNAFELRLGTGYTQGFGNLAPGRGIDHVAGAGIGANADFDYRMNPFSSFGIEAQYQEFNDAENYSSRGLVGNIGPTFHFRPIFRGDPWLRVATGYRLLWENTPLGIQNLSVLRHGFEPIAAKVGYDVRVSPDVAIAPFVGGDVNTFIWQSANNGPSRTMSSAQVGTFIYGGLQGRFNVGGTRSDPYARPYAQAPHPVGVTEAQPPTPPPVEETKPVSPSIAVSEDIRRECTLTIDSVERAPKFDFDKSQLQEADYVVLTKVAECFTTGPFKNDTLNLVGRADPRGTLAYNDALGMRRAMEVASFLEQRGVAANRIEKRSLGKRQASGHDEETWQKDRRVDILLGQ